VRDENGETYRLGESRRDLFPRARPRNGAHAHEFPHNTSVSGLVASLQDVRAMRSSAHDPVLTNLCVCVSSRARVCQEDMLRAMVQVTNILEWTSPETGSDTALLDSTGAPRQYDVIVYYIPPFVNIEDKEGKMDPVSIAQPFPC
jgi:hypothetical protein